VSGRVRLDRNESPWSPLVLGGEGLNRYPEKPVALRAQMADLYRVSPNRVLPCRGATHGLQLVMRRARLMGNTRVRLERPGPAVWSDIARIEGMTESDIAPAMSVVAYPPDPTGEIVEPLRAYTIARTIAPALFVIDESALEFSVHASNAIWTETEANIVVLRSLSLAYSLAGARCGAVLAHPEMIASLEAVVEPHALPTPTVRLAERALSPSRRLAVDERIRQIVTERDRVRNALTKLESVTDVSNSEGNYIYLRVPGWWREQFEPRALHFGVAVDWRPDVAEHALRVTIGTPAENDLFLAALGEEVAQTPHRAATIARDTKETRIVASVDLDRAGTREVHTGVGFFDHMLDQVAAHGGFGLTLAVEGDLHIDPHHTVEDATLALGAALKQALGDRAGIERYGFVLPMDEAEARISIDLGGRPFSVFDGAFHASHIGAYPTALTAHVFRSLAESMGAAIHVHVSGEDDHHKTEACFKALGRALRQAIRVEGAEVPSTKGVL